MKVQLRRTTAAVLALTVVLVGCADDNGNDTASLTDEQAAAVAFIDDYDRDEPAATVGDVTIDSDWMFELVEDMVDVRDPNGDLQGPERARAVQNLFTQLLSAVVVKEVIADIAADNGVEITDADVEAELDTVREQAGGDEGFEQMLVESGATLAVYREVLIPWELYQQRVEANLSDDYTPQELRDVRHILVETQEEAAEAFNRVEGGEAFGDVAEELSVDTFSGEHGGELGPSEPGRFVAGFEEAVWAAAIGELLGPVESEFGFHVAEVTDIRTYEADELDAETHERLLVAQINNLMTTKMANITITINPHVGQWDRDQGVIVPL